MKRVPDHQLEELLTGGWQIELTDAQAKHSLDALVQLRNSVRQVDVAPVRATLANAVRALRAAGVQLSDRRIVKAQKLIAAAALLRASLQATEVDLWPIFYVLPTVREQVLAREVLANQLAVAQNPCLQAAVEWAARKPISRAARLIEAAQHALQSEDANPAAVLREIDANFSSDDLPDALRDLRQALMQTHAERNASEQAPVTPDA
jgi:MoxR-like ATPase